MALMVSGFQTPTNWARLARALAFYQSQGFELVELNWHASADVCLWTSPSAERMYPFDQDALVGSAEQAFMQAQVDGLLVPGQGYVALTPCFRREPVVSDTHRLQFMKVELYVPGEASPACERRLATHAKAFMATEGANATCVATAPAGLDLEVAGVEVGSYVARSHGKHLWTCGTGLAEPRFSLALARDGLGHAPTI